MTHPLHFPGPGPVAPLMGSIVRRGPFCASWPAQHRSPASWELGPPSPPYTAFSPESASSWRGSKRQISRRPCCEYSEVLLEYSVLAAQKTQPIGLRPCPSPLYGCAIGPKCGLRVQALGLQAEHRRTPMGAGMDSGFKSKNQSNRECRSPGAFGLVIEPDSCQSLHYQFYKTLNHIRLQTYIFRGQIRHYSVGQQLFLDLR